MIKIIFFLFDSVYLYPTTLTTPGPMTVWNSPPPPYLWGNYKEIATFFNFIDQVNSGCGRAVSWNTWALPPLPRLPCVESLQQCRTCQPDPTKDLALSGFLPLAAAARPGGIPAIPPGVPGIPARPPCRVPGSQTDLSTGWSMSEVFSRCKNGWGLS